MHSPVIEMIQAQGRRREDRPNRCLEELIAQSNEMDSKPTASAKSKGNVKFLEIQNVEAIEAFPFIVAIAFQRSNKVRLIRFPRRKIQNNFWIWLATAMNLSNVASSTVYEKCIQSIFFKMQLQCECDQYSFRVSTQNEFIELFLLLRCRFTSELWCVDDDKRTIFSTLSTPLESIWCSRWYLFLLSFYICHNKSAFYSVPMQ